MEARLKQSAPLVSIVIAVHNDEEFVGRAIESALSQTERSIEVICVDDSSTDATLSVVEQYTHDRRLRIVRSKVNRSAYQSRRVGVESARAPFVLFLDGDDELVSTAAEFTYARAQDSSADVVGFGVEIVTPNGQGAPRFERSLQPKHAQLFGENIVATIFPKGQPAQGHLWKYLFGTELLLRAYAGVDESVTFYRANDIPVSFLALSFARKYVSISTKFYRYYFRRGTSGQAIRNIDDFIFYLSAIDSVSSIQSRVPFHARAFYDSARRSMIGHLVRDCLERTTAALQAECFALLVNRAGALDVVLAAADYCRAALPLLVSQLAQIEVPAVRDARSLVVTTAHLKTGGLRGVLATQVHYMADQSIDVTVALHKREPTDGSILPDANFAEISGDSWADKIQSFIEICLDAKADAIIDHHLLYDEYWPFYALAARTVGIGTIGWIHSFSLRPIFNGSSRLSFLIDNAAILESVVVLSPTDVAFWSLSGVENVVYLPNPPSPMLLGGEASFSPKELGTGPIELVWWGRLEQSTKQVRELLKVAKELRLLGTDFHLSIIGPDGPDLTRAILLREAVQAGVSDSVDIVGPLYDSALIAALERADIFLMTSAIEGYPLTLVEGQAHGLPTIMYEMPWLAYPEGNAGIQAVPQSAFKQMAAAVKKFADDPQSYAEASSAAVQCARPLFSLDFGKLYRELVENRLDEHYTPRPTAEQYATLLRLSVAYSERTARTLSRARTEITSLRRRPEPATSKPQGTNVPTPRPASALAPDIDTFQQYRKRASSPMRRMLTKLLPSTWRQANYIAERQAKWNQSALISLAQHQDDLAKAVYSLQESVNHRRR